MSSKTIPDVDVVLGFLEEPRNSLLLTAKYLPNKVGGIPVRNHSRTHTILGMDK